MGATSSGGHFFDLTPPRAVNQDRQKQYKKVCEDNEALLQLLTDTVHRYCLSGDCNSLGLLLKATSYLFQSGEQILIDNQICSSCGDRSCSAAGRGLSDVT